MINSKPQLKQVWWVSIKSSKYVPLIKRRIVYLSDEMVMLGLPDIKGSGDCRQAYILSSIKFVERWHD